jgi:hypothetical protein
MRMRLTVVAVAGMLLGLAGWWLFRSGPGMDGWGPKCLLHEWTGLHCAGCGMTRAASHLLHGRVWEAFRMNPLMVPLLPLVAVGIGLEIVGWVRGPDRRTPRLRLGLWGTVFLLVAILLFMVLRNLPWWPFRLLAPTG